jgi:hypothetical protein
VRSAVIRSDNGTKFVGRERELRKSIDSWNKEKINQFLTQRNVKWVFNPPNLGRLTTEVSGSDVFVQ